jgi:hypothetical protein
MECFDGCRSMASVCIPKKITKVGVMASSRTGADSMAVDNGDPFLTSPHSYPGAGPSQQVAARALWTIIIFTGVAKKAATFRWPLELALLFVAGSTFALIHLSFPTGSPTAGGGWQQSRSRQARIDH